LIDIFEPFKQLDASKTRRHFGSGLGLTITKKLVDLFNGKILVESEVHKGTRVIIDLPFQIQTNIPKEKEQKEKEMQHDTIKVLIVEDYYPNLLITQKFLEIWKIQSDFATNGEEAIHKVRQNHYDVILMDLHMPIMDGYTATEKIREFNQDIPIIAVTASALEDISEKIQKFGLTDVIIKPFKPDDLYKKIIHYAKKNNPEKSTSDFSI
jgi:CheY-like chemotaxis protein